MVILIPTQLASPTVIQHGKAQLMHLFNEGNVEAKIAFTTRCTAKCSTCLTHTIQKHHDLEKPLFEKFIGEVMSIEQIKLVSFYSIGESYLHREFIPMVEWAIPKLRAKNICTQIVTNGSLSTTIPNGLDDYFISFNAGTRETYEKITHLPFDRVVNNIWNLYNSGEFKKAKNFQIHMLVFEENKNEILEFRKLFFGMKGVRLRISYKYDNQHGESDGRALHQIRKKIPCNYLTSKIILYPNGDIILCSHDFLGSVCFGDLNKEPLNEILKKPERMKLIAQHSNDIFEGMCKECDYNIESKGQDLFKYYDADPQEEVNRLKNALSALRKNFIIKILRRLKLIRIQQSISLLFTVWHKK
jgi:radical SAM protein with 4Fe4S-binding SPASM domain